MSSSDDSDEDIPPTKECQSLCEQFAEVTGTDTACAQFYLQDRKWNLETSVNDFLEDRANKGAVRVLNDKAESEVIVVVDGSPRGLAAAATAVIAESALSRRSGSQAIQLNSKVSTSTGVKKEPYNELKFITWNVDGLDEKNLKLRTKAVYKRILNEQADVVFLQEVIPEAAKYFRTHLPDYHCLFGNEEGYFVGTFLKKTTVKQEKCDVIDFPDTRMMRNVLRVNVLLNGTPLCLLNSHLESTVEGSPQRMQQLKIILREMLKTDEDRTVVFAGDMNLRDKELSEIGGLPAGVEDVWVMCGSRKECSYTWDMTRNDNLLYNAKFKPRCRFDRVYLRGSSPGKLMPKFFGLIGLERLLPHRCFPSDHWGILCHFEVK